MKFSHIKNESALIFHDKKAIQFSISIVLLNGSLLYPFIYFIC